MGICKRGKAGSSEYHMPFCIINQQYNSGAIKWLTRDESLLFEGIPSTLCRLWQPFEGLVNAPPTSAQLHTFQNNSPKSSSALDNDMPTIYDPIAEGLESPYYDGIGNW